MQQGFFYKLNISEPPNEEEGFKKIDKVEIQLICNTPFKVSLLTSLPCDCIAIIDIKVKGYIIISGYKYGGPHSNVPITPWTQTSYMYSTYTVFLLIHVDSVCIHLILKTKLSCMHSQTGITIITNLKNILVQA